MDPRKIEYSCSPGISHWKKEKAERVLTKGAESGGGGGNIFSKESSPTADILSDHIATDTRTKEVIDQ